jgi:hypothetical protein
MQDVQRKLLFKILMPSASGGKVSNISQGVPLLDPLQARSIAFANVMSSEPSTLVPRGDPGFRQRGGRIWRARSASLYWGLKA